MFIVYCMDNQSHVKVVRKFARLLHQEGHCHVILERWHVKQINKYGVQAWVTKQCGLSDKIIVVGSEAVYKFIEARKNEQFWPALESAFPLSKVFPSAARALQDSISPHAKSKALAVTFDYTKGRILNGGTLRELTGNNIHYYLNKDLERLLLSIHATNKYEHGNYTMEWGSTILESKAGEELLTSIAEAEEFHQSNPTWFNDKYMSPVPYSDINDINSSVCAMSETCSTYCISDSDDESFTMPDDCSYEDIEETLNNRYPLVSPSEEDNASIELTTELIGPVEICSDSESVCAEEDGVVLDSGYGMSASYIKSLRPQSAQSDSAEYSTMAIRSGHLVGNQIPNIGNEHLGNGLLSSQISLSSPSSVSTRDSVSDEDELTNIQQANWQNLLV